MALSMALREKISSRLEDLTDDILVEILIRVPWRTTCRSKCISKRFVSLISSPDFVRRFRSNNNDDINNNLFMFVTRDRVSLLSKILTRLQNFFPAATSSKSTLVVDDNNNEIPVSFDFLRRQFPFFNVLSVSKDLVLIHDGEPNNGENLVICNPLTKQSFKLPYNEFDQYTPYIGCLCSEDDTSIYKVVSSKFLDFGDIRIIKFVIFSSDTGCWSNFLVRIPSHAVYEVTCNYKMNQSATVCNGKLHWCYSTMNIVVYDPFNNPKKCEFVEFPQEIIDGDYIHSYDSFNLSSVQGCLRLYRASFHNINGALILRFWDLKDYNNRVWSENLIDLSTMVFAETRSCDIMEIKGFDPLDGDVVYAYVLPSMELVALNIKTWSVFQTIANLKLNRPVPLVVTLFPYSQHSWPTPIAKTIAM
ncbi:uncharacterized protein [Spinacia oleracea]|uniref:F-box protein At3g26010-like beta-propeller domain-containing protein n=1 Tax=Spinacia oleracea TaxID=3562 RepID=A0A9R0HVN4_SPIOL|nr:uncharacterized protein LOC110777543 [Spinacia oleracea]